MATSESIEQLRAVLPTIRAQISKYRDSKRFNEQNTKASLILPVLQALGWDPQDPEDVHWEYKPKPKHNPVDFALMLKRTPCLFLEAKALRENLSDHKLVAQILTYASVAGVQWVVLSNGDEYRIYNASALVPAERKLFKTISMANDSEATVLTTMSLLSKSDLQSRKIERLWDSHFVDQQVKAALDEIFNPDEPSKSIVAAVRKLTDNKLSPADVKASLRRAQIQVDFPEEPDAAAVVQPASSSKKSKPRKPRVKPANSAASKSAVSIEAFLAEGLLKPPVKIFTSYRGHDLSGTILADGTIKVGERTFKSVSTAAGVARKPYHQGDLQGKPYPQTNGWTFWKVVDPSNGEVVALDELRVRLVAKLHGEASRFVKRA